MDDSQSTLIIKLIELSWTAGLIAVSRTVIDVVVLKYIQNYRKIFKALRLTSLIRPSPSNWFLSKQWSQSTTKQMVGVYPSIKQIPLKKKNHLECLPLTYQVHLFTMLFIG